MSLALEASFYVEEPPEITYRGGMFHVARQVGGYRFECVMQPHVYMLALRLSAEAAKLHFRDGEVIPFARPKKGAAGH